MTVPPHMGSILLPPNVGYRGMVPHTAYLVHPLEHVLPLVTNDVVFCNSGCVLLNNYSAHIIENPLNGAFDVVRVTRGVNNTV